MADNSNPTANTSNLGSNFLPVYYRTDANKKFLHATVDQLVQPGTVNKINGYIGRQNAKATTGKDIFIQAPTDERQNYQLEPGFTISDAFGNNTFFKDYQDYINQISVFGGNTLNHARINRQEFYSWDPHIDWDKFVNFQNYYWLPNGPSTIRISGQQQAIVSTYDVTTQSELGDYVYIFSPNGILGLTPNPVIKLYRGQTYNFDINSPGNPFSIKTTRTAGFLDRFNDGVSIHSVEQGTITFTVPDNAPAILYYVSESNPNAGGIFEIRDITENTEIDVDKELVGKKSYQLSDGTALSNGMKVSFIGDVTPAIYASGSYYVEGVGTSIRLISETSLEIISTYTVSESILFDDTPFDSFPFSDTSSYPLYSDYVTINRSSQDRNPWSRNNRWFHIDVINQSSIYNGTTPSIDQSTRATRPIIEFEPNLKLFNFGINAIPDVDLIDNFTTDVFSNVEGQLGYNIDGVDLIQGQLVLFTADTDSLVKNNIYRVNFVTIDNVRRINLVSQPTPAINNVVLVRSGLKNKGQMYWYDGTTWNLAQQKTILNQAPLFDVVDDDGISFGEYTGSTFKGSAIFSYVVGTGANDTILGFPLSYGNINNIGDILFNFNLATDTFSYKETSSIISLSIKNGYLISTNANGITSYVNGWQTFNSTNYQAAVRIYKNSGLVNKFELDIFNNISDLSDLTIVVYVNGVRLDAPHWSISDGIVYKIITLTTDINLTDVLTIRAFAKQPINDNGYYEIPYNLQNNPFNTQVTSFSLGEVIDHLNSIVDNLTNFSGSNPGSNNLRDLGNITQYGTKFVQHSGPLSLSLYHMTSETNNIIRAIEKSRDDYGRFKRAFITTAEMLGVDADPSTQVDLILQRMNKDKSKTSPYYFSDMVPYGASIDTNFTVIDYRIKSYPLSTPFTVDSLSSKAVLVYQNGVQLLVDHQYTFDPQGFVIISAELTNGDIITTREFASTNGSFVPETPSKLGIWPTSDPKIYYNTALVTPQWMIQGHDGSQTVLYGDYRDDILLELEKRIYNNIKVEYNSTIFDIYSIIPGYNRTTDYSLTEFNEILAPNFYKWVTYIGTDYSSNIGFDNNNPLTFNYTNFGLPDGTSCPGYWRGIYNWVLDTDRPDRNPWEMLGFDDEPTWWQEVYGPAPYTSDNLVLWQDLTNGVVRQPGQPSIVLPQFIRPDLINHIPVDSDGNLLDPLTSGWASGVVTTSVSNDFVFGDCGPVEAAWYNSSDYPFSFLISAMLLAPAKTFGLLLDRSRIIRNRAGQLIYSDTGLRVSPATIVLPNIYSSTTSVQTAGIINYIINFIVGSDLTTYNQYSYDLTNMIAQLSYRVSSFTDKSQFNFILDSRSPTASGSVFIPQENYTVIFNSSSPVRKISYSGVIISKLPDGYEVKGYSQTEPYFVYYQWIRTGTTINVGGISETYTVWTPGETYYAGTIVQYGTAYYRALTTIADATTFDMELYQLLTSLPIVGGKTAQLRTSWNRTTLMYAPYGTVFNTEQEVVDFLTGYEQWLNDQGFVFDDYNSNLNAVANWTTSAKEFLFWTTQNWSTGEDKWQVWIPNTTYSFSTIVQYQGEYYRAIRNSTGTADFNADDFIKLDGLSTVGSSVISLSPAADGLTFLTNLSVVDDITNPFYMYEFFKVDGTPIQPKYLDSYRNDNLVTYSPNNTDGIYNAAFYLIQSEHVILLDNATLFNDLIYNPPTGYRQERIKVSSYVSSAWDGSYNIPGFIYDRAKVQQWVEWQDYHLGDIVQYQQYYYSANSFLPGTSAFNAASWSQLPSKPTPKLLPNWTYKATQFTDFYSLDSDNFDTDQQKMAQHLIGYQKRQYLDDIIQDDVSEFKFYQGMIRDKGTQNVLNNLFNVLTEDGLESLTFYEEWAVRVGQYGASSGFEEIEFILDESMFKINPQGVELVSKATPSASLTIQQTPNDVYLKPIGYNSAPWPLLSTFNSFLRTAGYARLSDVKIAIGNLNDLTNNQVWSSSTQYYTNDIVIYEDSNSNLYILYIAIADNINSIPSEGSTIWLPFELGDYIWCGFVGQGWNIYRYSSSYMNVTAITYADSALTITTDKLVNLTVGSVIAIEQVDSTLAGFYQVASVDLNTFTVNAPSSSFSGTFTENSSIVIFVLTTQRASSINVADTILPTNLLPNELLWTDDSGDGTWATWQYNTVYNSSLIVNAVPSNLLEYGKSIVTVDSANLCIITTATGELIVRDRVSIFSSWIVRQTLLPEFISTYNPSTFTNSYIGDVLAISPDGRWVATGIPQASNVVSYYQGEWEHLSTYNESSIIFDTISNMFYQAMQSVPEDYPPTCLVLSTTVTTNIVTVQSGAGPSNPGQTIVFSESIGNLIADSVYYVLTILSDTEFTVSNEYEGNVVELVTQTKSVIATIWDDHWTQVQYIPVNSSGVESDLNYQGAISLYSKDKNNILTLVDTILSPTPTENEQFGSSLAFGKDTLFIGAVGGNSNTGKVYQMVYSPIVYATVYYNPVGSNGTTIKVSDTTNIEVGMTIVGDGFISGQIVAEVIDLTTFLVDVAPDSQPSGTLEFIVTQWAFKSMTGITESVPTGSKYGYSMSVSTDSSTLIVSSPGTSLPGNVFVYSNIGNTIEKIQEINGPDVRFGEGIAVSGNGSYIAISSVLFDGLKISEGSVTVYELTNGVYTSLQQLTNMQPNVAQFFGSKIYFMNDYKTLVVYSKNSSSNEKLIIDNGKTTFDEKATSFAMQNVGAGRVDVYDMYGSKWIFSETLENNLESIAEYGYSVAVANNNIFVSAIHANDNSIMSGLVYQYFKTVGSYTWTILNQEIEIVDVKKIKKAFLYNKTTDTIVTYLDVVDPLQGKILGVADAEIKYKTYYDPAIYSTGDSTVNVNPGLEWSTSRVGQLWWDLRTAKFFNCYDTDLVYRNSTWNTLFPGASIDIYEWVESTLLPEDWDAIADTVTGLASGISGTSLYGNTAYAVVSAYDNISGSFSNTYYFWVKNKTVVPDVSNRNISAQDVANLIANPRRSGYQYIAFTGQNSFSLSNVRPLLENTDIVLSVQYWTIDSTTQNIHSQWSLISTDPSTVLPSNIEQKWFDSLCGVDTQGRSVPDKELPEKLRYGIENRPRQGMFKNRFEALKQLIEQANRVLITNQIVDQFDLSNLEAVDPIPNTITGVYDAVISTVDELPYVNTSNFQLPSLIPIISNGRIIGIDIVSSGKGYLNAPFIEVVGSGKDAILKAVINSYGQITGVQIISAGLGYDSNTILVVRTYAALVQSDSQSNNVWSIYSYDTTTNVWSKSDTQAYNTTQFWNYVDWYKTGFNQFTVVDHIVNTFIDLTGLNTIVGDIVKVITNNSGNWMLLEKYADSTSIDWTQSYTVVGLQNGTLQFSSSLYQFDNNVYGYDSSLYDLEVYDDYAARELRYILLALKNNIFIDNLKQEYINLFFTSIRYALSEQLYVDWIFKTSFVKAEHNVGGLIEKVTYSNDNLADFQSYVAEVKPYRTKIREYVSTYNSTDISSQPITDFDLPVALENNMLTTVLASVSNGEIQSHDNNTLVYPWKFWLDNVGFSVIELVIVNGGSGYVLPPVIEIISDSGKGASAKAYISNGVVNRVVLIDKGSKYLSAPIVRVNGGLSQTGTPATISAIIGDSVIRSNLITMKFDRITQTYFITELQQTESFIGSGSKLQFPLTWAPDVRVGYSSVLINGIPTLRSNYSFSILESTKLGYTSYSGLLHFDTAPALGATIEVTYIKDWSVLNAADRIQFYYNPATGELGKDLSQLMTGIDYGGVNVNGIGFDIYYGWDSAPYYSDTWDSFDETFTDYIVVITEVEHTFTLPYIPDAGTLINVYYAAEGTSKLDAVRIDDPSYTGTPILEKPYVVMATITANGASATVSIPNTFILNSGDTVIFRQSTSDGSLSPQATDYDTALSGGDLAYGTATGLSADDIFVDGDGFSTQTACSATEEVVPGQVVDTLAIKVYDRPNSGSAKILIDTYIGNSSQTEYVVSQQPNSNQAVIVKLISGYQTTGKRKSVTATAILTNGVDYTLDYKNKTVIFNTAPTTGTLISITSFGFNGADILDIGSFIGDGSTTQFITTAPWISSITTLIYIDGVQLAESAYSLFETTNTSGLEKLVGIDLYTPVSNNSLISYIIVSGSTQTFSIMKSEQIQTTGVTTYALQNQVGSVLPNESNMIVRVGQDILKAPNNSYFTIGDNTLTYYISQDTAQSYAIDIADITVLVNGILLKPNKDYIVDLSQISVKITKTVYNKNIGNELIISIMQHPGYVYIPAAGVVPPTIQFDVAYKNVTAEVISFYKQDILDIQRTSINANLTTTIQPNTLAYFNHLKIFNGQLQLDRSVIDDNYIWVVKNDKILVPSIDFKLDDTKSSITLASIPDIGDNFTLITFGNNILESGISYMQFKDMLNRYQYKRLSANKQTVLVNDLLYTDKVIIVEDASNFTIPNTSTNKPGIVEIRGERIEYFTLTPYTNNEVIEYYILGQLRRGTLGTGTPAVHKLGSHVQDIGPGETIPYTDNSVIEQITSDGTYFIPLNFVPTLTEETWSFVTGFVSSIPAGYGQCDDIEVFVGGYDTSLTWEPGVQYNVGVIVTVGSYTYRCITNNVSSSSFISDSAYWTFFVGNIRLKKAPYMVYNVNQAPNSPDGDIQFDADFSVDGTTNQIRLTNRLAPGTRVTVIRKTGTSWDSALNIMYDTNKIAEFLKETPGIWYSGITKYESNNGTVTLDNYNVTWDSSKYTFDQG
jgi:hypothetical protein